MSFKEGVKVQEVVEQLDVPIAYLTKWRRDFREARDAEAASVKVDAISENKRLKDELREAPLGIEI